MTDARTQAPQIPIADDIVDPDPPIGESPDRRAEAYPAEDRAFARPRARPPHRDPGSPRSLPSASLRAAVRDDLDDGRVWMVRRVDHAREAIQDEPVRASLYALGVGVLIGLLLRR